MSWASHNPEKYDEIVRKGLADYLFNEVTHAGFEAPGDWWEAYLALAEVIQESPELRSIYHDLLHVGVKAISHQEAEYFSGLVDSAKERYEERESNP